MRANDSGAGHHVAALESRAWRALRASQEQLVELSPSAIFIAWQGEFVFLNAAAVRLYGASLPNELLETPVLDRVHPEHRESVRERLTRCARESSVAPWQEEKHLRLDGGILHVEVGIQPFVLDFEPAALVMVHDLTKRKQLEEQFHLAQKMEAIGSLAGGLAHDFNNILAVIRLNAELALMGGEALSPESRESLSQITAASERAACLTRQLLAFSRKQVMQTRPLHVNQTLQNLSSTLRRVAGDRVVLECACGPDLPLIQADVALLEQVLVNLAANAREAMLEGGHLRIHAQRLVLDETAARNHLEARPGEFVCLTVSDTGTGIAPSQLSHLFDPFFTTKDSGKGPGLGLATVYGIVKQHQGWVEVNSQVGTGTSFRLYLPATRAPGACLTPAARQPVRGGTETVLLVEDDPGVRASTRRILESRGYRVHAAASVREALDLWGTHRGEVQLLLTDIILQESATGRELADQLRSQQPSLKVIYISGYSPDLAGRKLEDRGAGRNYFLQKPCSSESLLGTIRDCLDQ